jgi:hypothetical protein
MISEYTRTRLSEINKDGFEESEEKLILEETIGEGRARYHLFVSNPSLLLKKLDEKWGFDFLKRTQCADCIVLELRDSDKCVLHIFEFKKTITKNSWFSTVGQYEGACVKGAFVAAFLGLTVEETTVNAGFRNDKFSLPLGTAISHAMLADKKRRQTLSQRLNAWDKDELDLDCFGGVRCVNKKIHLDENGDGEGWL